MKRHNTLLTFYTLKGAVSQLSILVVLDSSKSFTIETFAFSKGLGVVLLLVGRSLTFLESGLVRNGTK